LVLARVRWNLDRVFDGLSYVERMREVLPWAHKSHRRMVFLLHGHDREHNFRAYTSAVTTAVTDRTKFVVKISDVSEYPMYTAPNLGRSLLRRPTKQRIIQGRGDVICTVLVSI
jgi:hypothetical protein